MDDNFLLNQYKFILLPFKMILAAAGLIGNAVSEPVISYKEQKESDKWYLQNGYTAEQIKHRKKVAEKLRRERAAKGRERKEPWHLDLGVD